MDSAITVGAFSLEFNLASNPCTFSTLIVAEERVIPVESLRLMVVPLTSISVAIPDTKSDTAIESNLVPEALYNSISLVVELYLRSVPSSPRDCMEVVEIRTEELSLSSRFLVRGL